MNKHSSNIEEHFGSIASLIGERSRSIMLWTLLDGRAYTATELAMAAGISAQSASNHLSKLIKANLLSTDTQGRHKYYRFSNDKVAQVIEMIAGLLPVPDGTNERSTNENSTGIRYARTCYDHIAGKTGVIITKALLQQKILVDKKDRYEVSRNGEKWFREIGIDTNKVSELKRKFAYPCLDWTERKHHLGGALGAVLLDEALARDWFRKIKRSREILLTGTGRKELNKRLGIEL